MQIKAAVPKSSITIKNAVTPIRMQIGINLLKNEPRESWYLSQYAATKKIITHFASSEGWNLKATGPKFTASQRLALFTLVPNWGKSTMVIRARLMRTA